MTCESNVKGTCVLFQRLNSPGAIWKGSITTITLNHMQFSTVAWGGGRGRKPARITILYRFKLIAYLLSVELNPFGTVCFLQRKCSQLVQPYLFLQFPSLGEWGLLGNDIPDSSKIKPKYVTLEFVKNLLCILTSVIPTANFWGKVLLSSF